MDEGEKKFLDIIQEYGWHVMHVNNVVGEEENPTFSYSTGIYQNFQKPELIIFGLGNDLSGSIINEYGNDIKTNKQEFEANKYYDDFLEGYPVCMIEAHDSARKKYTCWADWYYQRKPFPILQCVWPSTTGAWPWSKDASDYLKEIQPIVGTKPEVPQ